MGSACAGVLLTGGASRRMGVAKAGLAPFGDPLAERTARLLAGCCTPCLELGPGWSGLPSVPDAGDGPLTALAGAGSLDAAMLLVVATDLPRLTDGLLAWLAGHPAPGAVVPLDEGGAPQWLCARYPTQAVRELAADPPASRRFGAWAASLDPLLVPAGEWAGPAGDALALADVDTPDDLARLTGRQPG